MFTRMLSISTKAIMPIALVFSLVSTQSFAGSIDTDYAADLIVQAQKNHEALPNIYRLNPDLSEDTLYDIQKSYIQKRLANGDSIGGYKGGFVPKASVGGVLWGGNEIIQSKEKKKSQLKLKNYQVLIVEAELGFKFCKTVSEPLENIEALKEAVCALQPVIEIADAGIENFHTIKKDFKHLRSALIPINVASVKTLIGKEMPADFPLDSLSVDMTHNEERIGSQNFEKGSELWAYVLWVVNDYVLQQGYSIEPGQFIIPGNLTGIHVAKPGTYVADYGSFGKLEVKVK